MNQQPIKSALHGLSVFLDTTEVNAAWQPFEIAVGEAYTSSINYLTFINDYDNWEKGGHSAFRHVSIYDDTPAGNDGGGGNTSPDALDISAYSGL